LSIESRADLIALRKIGAIVAQTLRAMKAEVKPGRTTRELDRIGDAVMKRHGAQSAPQLRYGFPAATCISVNEEVVHGIPGERILCEGDLITLDVTAERDGYIADAAISLTAGKSAGQNERLIGCAQRAFGKARRCGSQNRGDPSDDWVRRSSVRSARRDFTYYTI
jgi:methionyl aminopeptidase